MNYASVFSTIQKDGKIVTAGYNAIERYNTDGQPDSVFNGINGYRIVDSTAQSVNINLVAIQSEGKIVTIDVLPNQPPTSFVNTPLVNQIPLSYPSSLVLAPANVTLSATAYDPDPDGAISKVEFYD